MHHVGDQLGCGFVPIKWIVQRIGCDHDPAIPGKLITDSALIKSSIFTISLTLVSGIAPGPNRDDILPEKCLTTRLI